MKLYKPWLVSPALSAWRLIHLLLAGSTILLLTVMAAHSQTNLPVQQTTLTGYAAIDRWKQPVVYHGTQFEFLSTAVINKITGARNVPVAIDAQVVQPDKSGAGIVTAIDSWTKVQIPGFNFTLTLSTPTVKQAAGLPVHIQIYNGGKTALSIDPYTLSVVFVARDISAYTGPTLQTPPERRSGRRPTISKTTL